MSRPPTVSGTSSQYGGRVGNDIIGTRLLPTALFFFFLLNNLDFEMLVRCAAIAVWVDVPGKRRVPRVDQHRPEGRYGHQQRTSGQPEASLQTKHTLEVCW